jgi:ribosomal protein S27AE
MANDDDVIEQLSEILTTALQERVAPEADGLIASYAQRAGTPEASALLSEFYAELWAVFCAQVADSLAQHAAPDDDLVCPNCDDGRMAISHDADAPIGRTRYICGPCGYVEDR